MSKQKYGNLIGPSERVFFHCEISLLAKTAEIAWRLKFNFQFHLVIREISKMRTSVYYCLSDHTHLPNIGARSNKPSETHRSIVYSSLKSGNFFCTFGASI